MLWTWDWIMHKVRVPLNSCSIATFSCRQKYSPFFASSFKYLVTVKSIGEIRCDLERIFDRLTEDSAQIVEWRELENENSREWKCLIKDIYSVNLKVYTNNWRFAARNNVWLVIRRSPRRALRRSLAIGARALRNSWRRASVCWMRWVCDLGDEILSMTLQDEFNADNFFNHFWTEFNKDVFFHSESPLAVSSIPGNLYMGL